MMASSSTPYEERLDDIVSKGFLAMSIGLGHRVGLFQAFCDIGQPCTSTDLAVQAHLKERYVREWLGCMVAGKVVYVNEENKYFLPVDANRILGRGYKASVLPILGSKSPELVKCIKQDGPSGYNYEGFTDFNEWLDADRSDIGDEWVEENIVPVTKLLKGTSLKILDFGCGMGRLAIALAKYFPGSHVCGIDESKECIQECEKLVKESVTCSKNVTFLNQDGEHLPAEWTSTYDLIVLLDVLHDLADPMKSLDEIKRVLKPDGFMIAFDPPIHSDHKKNTDVPGADVLLTLSLFVCLPCSLSREPCIGHGIGWGYENRQKFLTNYGFKVVPIGDENLEQLNHRLVCKK